MALEDLDNLVQRAIASELDMRAIESLAKSQQTSTADAFNTIALAIAKRFDGANMTYEDADAAMNNVWHVMITSFHETNDRGEHFLPEPAFSIYGAFDEGEYDHRDGKDPIEAYTKPLIKTILAKESSPRP